MIILGKKNQYVVKNNIISKYLILLILIKYENKGLIRDNKY
jgi:hypothetical protein